MRIALVSVSSQLGGSEAVLVQLIAQLHRLRPAWPLHLVVPDEGPLVSRARTCGAEVHIVPMPASIARIGEWGGGGRGLGVVSQIAGAALESAPYDPVVNTLYLNAQGQRAASMRMLNTASTRLTTY